jgi:hypothetical protein
MARLEQQFDDDELSEILRLAVRKQEATTDDLRKRLLAVADELGISHSAVEEAEKEYRLKAYRRNELELYRKETVNSFKVHLGIYGIINFFLLGINLMSYQKDKEIWFPYVILGWGIAIAIHAMVALRKPDWDDEEFQKWRQKREELDD